MQFFNMAAGYIATGAPASRRLGSTGSGLTEQLPAIFTTLTTAPPPINDAGGAEDREGPPSLSTGRRGGASGSGQDSSWPGSDF